MNDPFNNLRETSWQRKLTPAEEAELRNWLAAHPEAREAWESDAALNRVLERLPEVKVSSNFTARVLQTVELETAAAARAAADSKRKWFWWSFLPKTALASVFVVMGVMAVREARLEKSQRLAKSVATVSQVASLPGPDVLKDFDAIQQLNRSPAPDTELLALLQ